MPDSRARADAIAVRPLVALVVALACLICVPLARADSPSNGGVTAQGGTGGASSLLTPPEQPPPDLAPPVIEGPTTPGPVGQIVRGKARAPRGAPRVVRRVIRAANRLRHKPYRYGGGHRSFRDTAYDCSGSVSYALHGGHLLDWTLDSTGLAHWGIAGPGRWITIYANRGHAFMVVAGLRFDTSGFGESGPRWRPEPRSTAHFRTRHPAGL